MLNSLRRITQLAALSFALTILSYTQISQGQTRPKVVATHSILCDLAEQIAQTTIDLTCLIEAGVDPHVYQSTPSDRRAIEDAQLILYNGYNFEPSIIRLMRVSRNSSPRVAVAEKAVPNPIMTDEHHHHHHHHHHEEESNGLAPDPHIWHNAQHGMAMARVIRDSLKELSPQQAELYNRNTEQILRQLEELHVWIERQVNTIPANQRTLVTTHDALGYFGETYGLQIQSALRSVSTEARPSAARIREVVNQIRSARIPTIFAETTSNPRLMAAIAREANVQLAERSLYADSLGASGSEATTYQRMLITNTCAIVKGLGGNCNLTEAQAVLQP